MTFFDFLKELNDTAKERLKTPITGAFFFSFVVWNWRPLAVLFFSDASIENKIVVINDQYCCFWAIFFPIVLAFFYTLLVPKIMVEINKDLAPTKNKRVDDIYNAKEHLTKRKISLAIKEFELKNVETGNKQIEELQMQIQALTEDKERISENYNNIIKGLRSENKDFKEMMKEKINDEIENFKKNNIDDILANKEIVTVLLKLNEEDIRILNYIRNSNIDVSKKLEFRDEIIEKFNELGLITVVNEHYRLSQFGVYIINRIS